MDRVREGGNNVRVVAGGGGGGGGGELLETQNSRPHSRSSPPLLATALLWGGSIHQTLQLLQHSIQQFLLIAFILL